MSNRTLPLFLAVVGLCWTADRAAAQVRVTQSAAAGTGSSSSPKQNSAPVALPVQNYAMIDLSGPSPLPGNPWNNYAMDDQHRVAFYFNDGSQVISRTFSNGVLNEPTTFVLDQEVSMGSGYNESNYTVQGILANGTLFGIVLHQIPSPNIPGNEISGGGRGFFYNAGGESENGRPDPFTYHRRTQDLDGIGFEAVSPGGSYSSNFSYLGITNPDGSETETGYSYATALFGVGKTVFWSTSFPWSLADTSTMQFIHQGGGVSVLTDTGRAVVYGYPGSDYAIWDGQNFTTSGMLSGYDPYCLNNQGWCLMDNSYGDGTNGILWHAGMATRFTDLLAGGAWAGQLSQVRPRGLSNENTADASLYAVTELLDNGADEFVVWQGTQGPTAPGQSQPPPRQWRPYRMQFPDGVTFDSEARFQTANDGVIVTMGNPGSAASAPGDGHVLLLVPLQVVYPDDDTDDSQANRVTSSSPTMTDKDGKVVTSLKVAKMIEAGVITGTGSSAGLNVDKDPDRFYVRLPGAASLGITSIKVDTIKNPDPGLYDDGPVELTVSKDGDDLVTKSLLLTSDDVDDGQPVDGVADNKKDDRTFKVELGGKFHIKSVTTGNTDNPADAEVPVPVKKTVHFTPIIIRSFTNQPPFYNLTDADAISQANQQLKIAKERYAQVGVNLTYSPVTIISPPAGSNIFNGLTIVDREPPVGVEGSAVLTAQAKTVIQALGTINDASDIHVFWVNSLNTGIEGTSEEHGGYAIAPFHFAQSEGVYCNNCFIESNQGPFVVAHELGHLLTNDGHVEDTYNLMWGHDQSPTNLIDSHKRLTTDQSTRIQNNKIGMH